MSQRVPAPVACDPRSFLIHGQRRLLISGEIHYARSPRALWPALLDRSRDCGLNSIASYIFWNFHEPRRDVYDFAGERDLGHFLGLCAERGLQVLLRAGPYCCAEWNYGGYPPYLRDEPGIVIRTWNPAYLRRVEKYFAHLAAEIRPWLATRGGPVVLVQVENEYANVAKRYGEDGQHYLAWIAQLATDLGLDVPLLMCEGGTPSAIETVNGFSISDARVAAFRAQHPQLPMLWTELWPAWYDTWGFQTHRRDPANIAWHLLRFLAHGGAGWNYYMWHGGTNFDRNAMYLQTTSYGFEAPLDEFGRITPKARYLAGLHHAVAAQAELLLAGERRQDGPQTVWTLGRRRLELELDPARAAARLCDGRGRLLFATHPGAACSSPPTPSPVWRPALQLEDWQHWPEPFPAARGEAPRRAPAPVEQLGLTQDRSDYCWYSTTLTGRRGGEQELEFAGGADFFYLYLDGRLVAQSQPPFRENRGPTLPDAPSPPANDLELLVRDGFRHRFRFPARPGKHRLDILAVALGLVKGDWQIAGSMETERKGLWLAVRHQGRELRGWEMRPFLAGELQPELRRWRRPGRPRPCTWYRCDFALPERLRREDRDFRLDARGLGKGLAFLNGHALGRYWLLPGRGYGADEGWQNAALDGLSLGPAGEPTQRWYHVPRAWLQPQNTLTLFEETALTIGPLTLETRLWRRPAGPRPRQKE